MACIISTGNSTHLGYATYRKTNIKKVHEAYMLVSSPNAGLSFRLVHLHFVWQKLAAAVDMVEDSLFQLGHLIP